MLIDTLQLTQLPQVKVSWDILVSTYVFFVVSSTGMCMITSVGHVFGVKRYEVIGRRGVFLAIVTLVSGWIAILIHLGRMERLPIYYILTANLSSAMWWMGFFYAFYFVFLIIELWFLSRLDIVRLAKTTSGLKVSFYRLLALGSTDESEASFKRDMRWVMIFGLAGVISAIAAHSTLGAVFGNVERALWYGAHMPLYFILTALISGSAWLILVTILTYTLSKREMSLELKNLMFELGKVFGFLVALGLLFTSWKVITAIMNPAKFAYVSLLLTESFSLSFWGIEILLGAIVPFLIVFIPRTGKTFSGLSVAALLCLMGIFMVRYDWTVAGQVIPVRGLPSLLYIPSYIEALIVVGIVTLCVLLYTWGVRNLPLEHKAVIPT